jgi:quercetin dioxygenase-like cupin family protein
MALSAETKPAIQQQVIDVGALRIRFLVTGEESNNSAAVMQMTVPVGTGLPAPPHSHDGFEETVYGLSGRLAYTVAGHEHLIGPGDVVCIPRGVVHVFANSGTEEATVLIVLSPAGLGPDYFREVAAALADANGGPPDRARMGEIMRRNGLTPAPPPGA